LPSKDEEGRFRFLDLGYILPFGDLLEIFDKAQGAGGANISFEPLGGPFQPIAEVAFNKSLFTGRSIYLDTDTLSERYAKISDHVLKGLLPALAPPIPGTGFRGGFSVEAFRKAIAPEVQLPMEAPLSKTDFLGRQRSIVTTFASKILGINIKDVSLQDLQRLGLIEFQRKLEELNLQMARIARAGVSDEQKQVMIGQLTEKYRALVEQTREKFTGQTSKAESGSGFVHDLGFGAER
jgi:hypothetical protein